MPDRDLILMDFDGVIVESVGVKTDAFARVAEVYGSQIASDFVDYHLANLGVTRHEKFRYLLSELVETEASTGEVERLCAEFQGHVERGVIECEMVPGALDFLAESSQHAAIHVISATPGDELRRIVDNRDLGGFFAGVHGAGRSKAAWMRTLLSEYGLKPAESIYVGDALADFEAAVSVGVPFVGRVPVTNTPPFPTDRCVTVVTDLSPLAQLLRTRHEATSAPSGTRP